MKSVRQLLKGKTKALCAVRPEEMVFDAIKLMAEQNVGALLVMQGAELVGIVSERDYARKVILQGRSSKDTAVSGIMSSPVVSVAPENTLDECMALMTDRRIRHLAVLEKGSVVGVLSIGDLVKQVIADQREQIQQLEAYIHG